MNYTGYEASLTALERSVEHPLVQLQIAAKIINIDFDYLSTPQSLTHADYNNPSTQTFPEQWLLRWLLKRLSASISQHSDLAQYPLLPGTPHFHLIPQTWSLLYCVITRLPDDICLEILVERQGIQLLGVCLRNELQATGQSNPISNVPPIGEPQSKKRRVSGTEIGKPSTQGSPTHGSLQFFEMILICFVRCGAVLEPITTPRQPANGTSPSAWTANANDMSMTFALGLQGIISSHSRSGILSNPDTLQNAIVALQNFWNPHQLLANGVPQSEIDQKFGINCLAHLLETIKIVQSIMNEGSSVEQIRIALDKLIAIHTIVPLRAIFIENHAATWKDVKMMHWDRIEPFYNICAERFDRGHVHDGMTHEKKQQAGSFVHLLDIALSILPTYDSQKRKWEQGWLNALFTVLTYIVCPGLPKMTVTEKGNYVHYLNKWSYPISEQSLLPVENMLDALQRQGIDLTIHLTGYFLWSALSISDEISMWRIVALLLRANIDVVLPKSGIDIALDCFKKLDKELRSKKTVSDDEVILHRIAIPMLHGFVRTRDLFAFIDFWQHQITSVSIRYDVHDDNAHRPLETAWLNEELLSEFQRIAIHHSNTELTDELFKKVSSSYDIGQWKRGGDKWLSRPYGDIKAYMPILAAYLRGLLLAPDRQRGIEDRLLLIQGLMCATIKHEEHLDWCFRWRAWDLIHSIQQHLDTLPEACAVAIWEHATSRGSVHSIESFTRPFDFGSPSWKEWPNDANSRAFDDDSFPRWDLAENLECFSLALEVASRFDDEQVFDYLDIEFKELAVLLRKLLDTQAGSVQDEWNEDSWVGGSDKLSTGKQYVDAYLAQLLLHPAVILKVPDMPHDLIRALVSTAANNLHLSNGNTFQVTTTKLCRIILTESCLSNNSAVQKHLEEDLQATSILQYIPVEYFPKTTTAKLITTTLHHILDENEVKYPQRVISDLELLLRFSGSEKTMLPPDEQLRNWTEILLGLDQQINTVLMKNKPNADYRVLSAILQGCRRGLVQSLDKLKSMDEKRLSPILKYVWSWCKRQTDVMGDHSIRLLPVLGVHILLRWLLDHKSRADIGISDEDVSELQARYAQTIADCLTAVETFGVNEISVFRITVVLDILEQIDHHFLATKGQKTLYTKLVSAYQKLSDDKEMRDLDSKVEGAVAAIGFQIDRLRKQSTDMPTFLRTDLESELEKIHDTSLTSQTDPWKNIELGRTARAVDGLVQKLMSPSEYITALTFVTQSEGPTWLASGPIGLLLIASIALRTKPQEILETPNLGSLLANIACLKTLPRERSLTNVLMHLDNSRLILENHSAVVNQSTIDALLGELCLLVSSMSSDLEMSPSFGDLQPITPGHVYDRICGLIGVLLTRYRRRISDRFNLLLPCLQGLLRCLFYPGAVAAKSRISDAHNKRHVRFIEGLPGWIRDSEIPLSASSAQGLSRILISISNPTVSAARSSKKRGHGELNDEVQKTRRIAGQHLQYIIVEYSKASLDGQIEPDVKAKLAPGLYSILDSMGRDLMRGVNAAMDPSSRAIFKILYDDWTKFGRWDKT